MSTVPYLTCEETEAKKTQVTCLRVWLSLNPGLSKMPASTVPASSWDLVIYQLKVGHKAGEG